MSDGSNPPPPFADRHGSMVHVGFLSVGRLYLPVSVFLQKKKNMRGGRNASGALEVFDNARDWGGTRVLFSPRSQGTAEVSIAVQ